MGRWWRGWTGGVALAWWGLLLWTALGLNLVRVAAPSGPAQAALRADLTAAERAAIQEGRVRFLDGREAVRKTARPSGRGEILVVLETPAVFRSGGGLPADPGERALALTEAAVRLRARLLVDCTDADLARLTPAGWRSVRLAKRAGLWRMVVFDGAHHLPALAADPEILLLPLLTAGGESLIIHGFVRDALPLTGLQRVLGAAGLEPLLLTIPRLSLPLKENLSLRLVTLQALRRVAEAIPPSGGPLRRPGHRIPLAGVVVGDGMAWLPGGLVLAGRPEGQGARTEGTFRSAGPVRQRWVAVSHGTFTLFRPARSRPSSPGAGPPPVRRPGEPTVVELGWPVSVWDLLLRYPGALAGQPLPWSFEKPHGSEGK